MRFLPDWLVYALAIGAIVFVLFAISPRTDVPGLDRPEEEGQLLQPPSIFDPEILVDVGPVSSGLGTAFAISHDGWWMTARHVVDECDRVGIVVGPDTALEVHDVRPAPFADLALLHTDRAPAALPLDETEADFHVGQRAFHMGYPQGRTGEASSRLIGRETLIARGRYQLEQPVLAWAETGRTQGLLGSLAGMSGGPALDRSGRVIGVTVAESSRRGRIYTASPASIMRLLNVQRLETEGDPPQRVNETNYGARADTLRRALAIAQVICIANNPLMRR